MRLIDADALKEEVNKKKVVGRFNTIMLIDNAPTVEYPFYQEAYQTGYEEGKNERTHGEWEKIGEIGLAYKCNKCGEVSVIPTNYCHNCGAYMRGVE